MDGGASADESGIQISIVYPSNLAYGERAVVQTSRQFDLIFEVELLDAKPLRHLRLQLRLAESCSQPSASPSQR
jgi:hypothetical protein